MKSARELRLLRLRMHARNGGGACAHPALSLRARMAELSKEQLVSEVMRLVLANAELRRQNAELQERLELLQGEVNALIGKDYDFGALACRPMRDGQ